MRAEYEFDVADFQDRGKSDSRTLVRFFINPVKNEARSLEEGRPIFDEKEYCEIVVPGLKNNRPIKPVNDMIKRRFPAQYAQWKATGEGDFTSSGTPLSQVMWINRSQVEELAYFRIRTLEQLAEVSDTVCQRMIGMYDLRNKAKAHVEAARQAAPIQQLHDEIHKRDAEIELLKAAVADLQKKKKGDD